MTALPAACRPAPQTGVITVMDEAVAHGFRPDSPQWCNFGQGAPEVGSIPGCDDVPVMIPAPPHTRAYPPFGGIRGLRQAVADFYNAVARPGKRSQYTWENVCITASVRAALVRTALTLGPVPVGHLLPDYAAYEPLLSTFTLPTAVPLALDAGRGFTLDGGAMADHVDAQGLKAFLFSNPCNPTGAVLPPLELERFIARCLDRGCLPIVDECYDHYLFDGLAGSVPGGILTAASAVDDVERDHVLIVDGLTKNWRLPGWRLGWALGPSTLIRELEKSGSYIDGGPSHHLQEAAITLLDPAAVVRNAAGLRAHFQAKRDWLLPELTRLGLRPAATPAGTFYVFVDLSPLPESLRDASAFARRAFEHKTVVVPDQYFDINPRDARPTRRFTSHLRLSYGPPQAELERGVAGLARLLESA